jgi:hypothetical protein
MTEFGVLPENISDLDVMELRSHIGKKIAFNAGKNRLTGTLLSVDAYLNLKIRVDSGREPGIHRLRLGRMGNYALLDGEETPKKSAPKK